MSKAGAHGGGRFGARHGRWIRRLLLAVTAPFVAHTLVDVVASTAPPSIDYPTLSREPRGARTYAGRGYFSRERGVIEAHLEGRPEDIGAQHGTLLYDLMVANEREVWDGFSALVPFAPARVLLFDMGRILHRNADENFPLSRRKEIAAEARAFSPDPYAGKIPTYERMISLHALYDISLGFEHSPLLGCSAFALSGSATRDGHTIVARAFDFDAHDVFDRDKAVFFVKPDGAIPFASVAWPGLVGVLTGMNREGVFVSVNGARARDAESRGLPVVSSLRATLEGARTTGEAIAILLSQEVMVSHIVFVADARGDVAIVERAPHVEAHVVRTFADRDRVAVTNHFEGPLREDPKNLAVRASSTTVARRARLDELLPPVREATPESALALLRDKRCPSTETGCAPGDRRTLDALIATHGVVADTTAKVLWVSLGPHLSGKFVGFDLRREFDTNSGEGSLVEPGDLPEDPIVHDTKAYEAGRTRAGPPLLAPRRR
ncbi:MAG: hypothetical protein IPK71_34165 [Myxococcales bacterium]|nr:hypothetical protein [Myxococcales bacterium]